MMSLGSSSWDRDLITVRLRFDSSGPMIAISRNGRSLLGATFVSGIESPIRKQQPRRHLQSCNVIMA
ncbi:hypothetical protein SCLCIDRAFT_1215785 [Scleroderma citrinum Foug A]|uniref:Uncharacterized protein n=1 Tax=Scleroderma citrinum Foug A TaxID=1036808 RepID=A0A0C2ZJD0_9AGAM|nr:hypothetical protein SCLCIDRAFT_1215785 [Scleroderma citrinum Foug A]